MLNRYIARKILFGILVAFAIITSIIMLVDFVETGRNLSASDNISFVQRLAFTSLNAPILMEPTLPFIILFGVMGAFFSLNKKSEIIVMRASGLSVWKLLRPAIACVFTIGIVWTISINSFSAYCAAQYQKLSHELLNTQHVQTTQDIWLREGTKDGHLTIHARSLDPEAQTLTNVSFYYTTVGSNKLNQFLTRYDAKSAKLTNSGYWIMNNVIENDGSSAPKRFTSISKPTSMSTQTLVDQDYGVGKPAFWQINKKIERAKKAGYDSTGLILHLHKLLALPFTLVAMTLIATAASLKLSRSGGSLRLVITGASLGFGFYFFDTFVSAFGENGTIPPILAAWTVPILTLFCGLAYLSKIEDG